MLRPAKATVNRLQHHNNNRLPTNSHLDGSRGCNTAGNRTLAVLQLVCRSVTITNKCAFGICLSVYVNSGKLSSLRLICPCPGMWGGGAQSVDNGTATWGQSSDAAASWGDPDEPSKASGWGNPSPNSGKPGKRNKIVCKSRL